MKKTSDKDHMPYVLRRITALNRRQLRIVGDAIGNAKAREEVREAMRVADRANKLGEDGQGYVAKVIADRIKDLLSDEADEMSDTRKGVPKTSGVPSV